MSTSYIASSRDASLKQVHVSFVGMISFFSQSTPPNGWLVCDGSAYERSQYIDLFNAIGITYGNTTPTNFKVPDLRGCFVRGIDFGKGSDPARVFASYQPDSLKKHKHTATITIPASAAHTHTITGTSGAVADHLHNILYHPNGGGCAHLHGGRALIEKYAHPDNNNVTSEDPAHTHTHTLKITSGGAHTHAASNLTINDTGAINETRPKNTAMLPCIKF